MGLGLATFVVVVFATFFNNALHFYTQVQTYPLFAWVGRDGFVPFHKEYQRRLPLAIYAPYSLLMAANALLLVFRPAEVAVGWVISLLILNASVLVESLALAAPVHYRMDHQTGNDKGEVGRLIRLNAVRLAASTASSIIVVYLLVRTLAP
ncbi:MAG: hypothetical protein AVDCRST_MAG02-2288 [uncultured Rubrobacteraceae bacterium]|uniref:DUF1772 domain-containing protein n=1 Tax=uncultured Rubrobacteraceae bacterium TaxID=349277 RepID=A0A6J4R115_9ACTN|nr:MAG: hypothetical protein AVDCRST_MAG02-2288 [uncultured Rubrobacteraceae bacterium]